MSATPPAADPEKVGRTLLARHLLRRAHEALDDAGRLLRERRLRGAAGRAIDAALDGARALLAPRGLDCPEIGAATVVFDRQLVATDMVSRTCAVAIHRALRTARELFEGDIPVLYEARVAAVRDGAAALLAEADIVIDRLAEDVPRAAAEEGGGAAEDDEF